MQAPSERIYRPLETFFECLTRGRFAKADEHLKYFFNSMSSSPFLREFHGALDTFCQAITGFQTGRFLPYVLPEKKGSFFARLASPFLRSSSVPNTSSASSSGGAGAGGAGGSDEDSAKDFYQQQILDVLDGVRKCKFYLEESKDGTYSGYSQFFSGLLQQLQVIAESKRVLLETYVWLFCECKTIVDTNDQVYFQHRDALLNLATLRQTKEQLGINPYLAWLWHDCNCEATLLLLLLQLHSAHGRQSFLLSCLYLQDALKTFQHWHQGYTAHRTAVSAAASRTRSSSIASPRRRGMGDPSTAVAVASALGRSVSTDNLALSAQIPLDDMDNYDRNPPVALDRSTSPAPITTLPSAASSGHDNSNSSSSSSGSNNGERDSVSWAPPGSRFASFLSDVPAVHNSSSVALSHTDSSSASSNIAWDLQYFGPPSATYGFLKEWLRVMSYRTAFFFARLLHSLEGGLSRGLQSNNPYHAALENLFARTQAEHCFIAYRRSRDSEYHAEGYRLPLLPSVAAQEFASPFSVAKAPKAKREAFDGLKSYPCIFSLPGPAQEPRKDQWANIVSLILQEQDTTIHQPPRCYHVVPSTYFLTKIDNFFTLVVFSLVKRKPSDSSILNFFASALPLLRTTDVIAKSLVPRLT